MNEPLEASVDGTTWRIRQVQAIDDDPMVDGLEYTFSVESDADSWLAQVHVAPICYHLSSLQQRASWPQRAAELVREALAGETCGHCRIEVSSDGVACVDGRPLRLVFPLHPRPVEVAEAASRHG